MRFIAYLMGMECQLGACSQIGAPCSLKKDYQSLFSKKYPPGGGGRRYKNILTYANFDVFFYVFP